MTALTIRLPNSVPQVKELAQRDSIPSTSSLLSAVAGKNGLRPHAGLSAGLNALLPACAC